MVRTAIVSVAIAALFSGVTSVYGREQARDAYPNQPIRFVVPFVAGGSYDVVARLLSKNLSEVLGQRIVVDNRAGAGGLIGTQMIQKAAADGYTLGMFGNPQTIAVNVNPNADYDIEKDFTPIAPLAVLTNVLVIHGSVPAHSLKEFMALAKSKPGQFNYGSGGVGATTHLAGELFKSLAGVQLVHVPYKGSGAAVTELLSGQVQFMVLNMVLARPFVESGKVRALAVASARRSSFLPEVPSMSEAGLTGYEFSQWYGVVAPAKLSGEIVNQLNREITKIVQSPEFKEGLMRQGVEPMSSDSDTLAQFIKADAAKYRKIVKEQHILAD
jgi:tripartite-type tricarboxylate transporter receptor subunit TctC